MIKKLFFCLVTVLLFKEVTAQPSSGHNLYFDQLAKQWDEAIPLGNGMLGALVWQKDGKLHFSLDRADLWDQRPMKGLHRKEFSYNWIIDQVHKKDYGIVQEYFDEPYDREPAPSKIPGGALEFDTRNWGKVTSVNLSLNDALCEVKWVNGVVLKTFVAADKSLGWFKFDHIPENVDVELVAPKYQGQVKNSGDPVGGDDLSRLGYPKGTIVKDGHSITYDQSGWGGFSYQINVRWKETGKTMEGSWSISSRHTTDGKDITAKGVTAKAGSFTTDFGTHQNWWKQFWQQSAIQLPDALLEKQWYLEQYKFGSVARTGAPPISLQAIWTADNGRLPPWKGDYHHDLNTQLSYWPAYSGNHLKEAMGYLDYLEKNKENYKRYTKTFFESDGIAVPGVTTLDGTEMGGWVQYSLSPTVSAWLGQHYYLQWRYSMDRDFLKQKAYPWIKATAKLLEDITILNQQGHRQLKISSSPEINDNSLEAWFPQNTNYDLALMKFAFKAAAELADELGLKQESQHWKGIYEQFDNYALSANQELKFAPTMAYNQSHRHFSSAMAIHPLGLIKWEDGAQAQTVIKNTIHLLDSIGPAYWCGYSYAWMGNMKARAKDGEGAAKDLEIFAKAFCSVNSFHLNGDQTKSGYSKFTYRPFTLEGNFAFAAGLQEMLLQSYAGFIEIMPAVPSGWKDLSFNQLRAEGAVLVSAKRKDGLVREVRLEAEKGGEIKLKLPFKEYVISSNTGAAISVRDGLMKLICKPGALVVLKNK